METTAEMWEILVPDSMHIETPFTELTDCYHTGEPVNKIKLSHHRVWDAKIRSVAGGLTVMRTAKGEWYNESNFLFSERMIPVRIVCSAETMRELASFTKEYYRQEKVLYYKISNEVYFV